VHAGLDDLVIARYVTIDEPLEPRCRPGWPPKVAIQRCQPGPDQTAAAQDAATTRAAPTAPWPTTSTRSRRPDGPDQDRRPLGDRGVRRYTSACFPLSP
jgi:hypothetical protein